jgi:hypothetical protein
MADLQSIAQKNGFSVKHSMPTSQARNAGYSCRGQVLENFMAWTTMFEGYTPFLYADKKGLVTTGIGNLVDPKPLAQALPFKHSDGSAASADEIGAAWDIVKQAWPGTQSFDSQKLTTIRLDKADIEQLVKSKLLVNDRYLTTNYPGFADWPADAQLALHSMAWAMGPAFNFPSLKSALASKDFATAATQCHINETGNPGVIPRNQADVLLFQNAAQVAAGKGNPETLYYLDPPTGDGGGGGIVSFPTGALSALAWGGGLVCLGLGLAWLGRSAVARL